ncbi:hypothetical protein M2175_004336 [Bradyrhizobium elkanii]|uniref:hypothetical protein n=1 Tax=Bradyrhizobium TaxID=374 RepID=UPI000576F3BB|nr:MULTISPECIES: hypothetical protein [Bradyrhizobium]MBR0914890.1 hypothetical protein [Bradyrhizobium japonicum]MCS3929305.1 hypothetical protein [Bradyrhizobium elkanii]MCS3969861.1 hypothetical protein [Bradyrhizobium japonicum]
MTQKRAGPADAANVGEAHDDRHPGAIDFLNSRKFRRAQARDRHRVAVHEAGHVVIAQWLGCEVAAAWIFPHETWPGFDELTWLGKVQFAGTDRLSIHARRMIGVAGIVAEGLWCGWAVDELDVFFPDYGSMSPRDYRLAGYAPDHWDDDLLDTAAEVGRLLDRCGPLWNRLVVVARQLIVEARP